MLVELALRYLRFKKVSVIMNCVLEGGKVQQKTNRGATYDSVFINVDYRQSDGYKFTVPEGKFKIKRKAN